MSGWRMAERMDRDMGTSKSLTFEENMKRLQKAADLVSSGQGSLEEMASRYRDGIEAAKACLAVLKEMDGELTVISKQTEELLNEEMDKDDQGSAANETKAH